MNLDLDKYSERTQAIFQSMYNTAAQMGHGFIGSEHILLGIAQDDGKASLVLKYFGLDAALIQSYIKAHDSDAAEAVGGTQVLQFAPEAEHIFTLAEEAADNMQESKIEPEHLLLGILKDRGCAAACLLLSLGRNLDAIQEKLLEDEEVPAKNSQPAGTEQKGNPAPKSRPKKKKSKKDPGMLEQYGHDLTEDAENGYLDPVIGRRQEMDQLVQVLSRRKKNNPVLVGEPGVGKTVIVEGLAQRIVENRIPKGLQGKRIIALDLPGMLSGTRFRGDFEERIKTFLTEAKEEENVILFLDEMHTLVGTGVGDGAMDAANILKPELANGDLQVIGATTPKEYTQYIEKDAALERRFQQVLVEEPTQEETYQILKGLQDDYEQFHELVIRDEAIHAAVTLSARYIGDRYLPDKAIDLIDEAAARVRSRNTSVPPQLESMDEEIRRVDMAKKKAADSRDYEEADLLKRRETELIEDYDAQFDAWHGQQKNCVDAEDIAEVVSTWTKIPVTTLTMDEQVRLKNLEETLHKRIIGQDEAVSAVARAIRRSRTGVAEPGRPIASFLFLGPTGVGKTELSKALAEVMFQDEDSIIRFDMSEYMEPYTVSRLIGSPPGYVGYEEGGQLTDQVRKKPYSIILLDEIEKAHQDVWNVLLQILDDGRLTDGKGRTVDFKNTIIIMTSNLGTRSIESQKTLGFKTSKDQMELPGHEEIKDDVMKSVKQAFPPEFINRLDDVIVFHALEKEDVKKIAANLTAKLCERLEKQGISLTVKDSAIEVLAEKGYDPAYGARPLRRVIQNEIEDALSDLIVDGDSPQIPPVVATGTKDGIRLVKCETNEPVLPQAV